MSEYAHLLVAKDSDFTPSPAAVVAFIDALEQNGALPNDATLTVRTFKQTPPPQMPPQLVAALGPSPFAAPSNSRSIDKAHKAADSNVIGKRIAKLDEYDAVITGQGPPKITPFPLDFDGEYHYEIRCSVRSTIVCTSDMHEEVVKDRQLIWFGDDCGADESLGLYAHPETLELITVADAGCARFWIAFELGKFLFPKIHNGDLQILDSQITITATDAFPTPLLQACQWSL